MNLGGTGYLVSKFIIYFVLLVLSLYGTYAIYYGYVKMKDERQKYIVLQSIAQAFLVSFIFFGVYYISQIIVNISNVKQLTLLWNLFHFDTVSFSAGSALSWMMAFLGLCLFFNKHKNSVD